MTTLTGGLSISGWGALGVNSAVAVDYAQSAGRGYFNGFQASSTLGGSLIGERNYAIASLGFGWITGGVGVTGRFGRTTAAERTAAIDARGGAYLLRDPANGGAVVLSGRSGNLASRAADYRRDPLLKDFDFDSVYRTDVYAEQRGLEQILHDQYSPALNKIRPISPTNRNRQTYLDAAQRYLLEYGGP